MENFMWIIWLVVFVVALLVEWGTAEVVSIWFALAAVVSLILSFVPNVAWWVQLVVFVVIAAATFAFLRPFLKRLIKKDKVDTNIDEIIGKRGIMTEEYTDLSAGEVKVNGVLWTAINTNEEERIEAGSKVVVVAINGNKLIVKKLEKEQ